MSFHGPFSFAGVYIEQLCNGPDEDMVDALDLSDENVPSKPKVKQYDPVEEAFVVGNKILALKAENRVQNYKEFAILLRNKGAFDIYREVFDFLKIPLQVQTTKRINEAYFFKLMANILMLALKYKDQDEEAVQLNRFNYLSLARSELFNYNDYEIFNSLINQNGQTILNISHDILDKLEKLNDYISYGNNTEIVDQMIRIFDIYSKMIYGYNLDTKKMK